MSTLGRARRQLAGGTLLVAVGLGLMGVGTVLTMALTARSLPAADYAAFAVWWTVATVLGTSFGVFEAYLARLVVADRVAGRPVAPVVGVLTWRVIVVVVALAVGVWAASPTLSRLLFDDHLGAALLLPLFTALAAAQAIQRGVMTGHQDFRAVAAQLSCDGVVRVLLAGAVVAAGVDSVVSLALVCCAASASSLVVGGLLCPPWAARPRGGREVATRPLLYLLAGSVGPLLANNGSVPWLAGTGAVDVYTLGAFAGAVTLSRIPAQFVSAVFSPLLTQLAQTVESGDRDTFTRLRRTAASVAVVLGIGYVAAFALLGPWLIRVYLGPGYDLATPYLAVLAAASSLMFVAVVSQAGLAALNRWPRIGVAWILGTVGFVVVLLLPGDQLWRASTAPLVGVLTALLALTVLSWGAWELRTSGGGVREPPRA